MAGEARALHRQLHRGSRRLLDTEDKLESIARQVGCSSQSSFSRLFAAPPANRRVRFVHKTAVRKLAFTCASPKCSEDFMATKCASLHPASNGGTNG
jgi:hypothetical protein